jgi:hypothetical protein
MLSNPPADAPDAVERVAKSSIDHALARPISGLHNRAWTHFTASRRLQKSILEQSHARTPLRATTSAFSTNSPPRRRPSAKSVQKVRQAKGLLREESVRLLHEESVRLVREESVRPTSSCSPHTHGPCCKSSSGHVHRPRRCQRLESSAPGSDAPLMGGQSPRPPGVRMTHEHC